MTSPLEQCRDALRRLTGAAFPVSTEIDGSGYAWSHAYLDSALPGARAALAAADAALAAQPEPVAWLCELAMEDGTTRQQFVTEDPDGLRWNDAGEPSPYRTTPLYAAPVAAPVAQPLTDEPVCFQWLDSTNFRKTIPAASNPAEWRPIYEAHKEKDNG